MFRWKVARITGIYVYVNASFLLLPLFIVLSTWERGAALGSQRAAIMGLMLILATMVCVVLHELGHALTARRFGIQTKTITLYPIGGVAALERIPEQPAQELIVALAGPAVNFVLAGLCFFLAVVQGAFSRHVHLAFTVTGANFMLELVVINLWFGGFNLLPAFPMDGGRVLRALLAMKMPRPQATRIAAGVGQAMAFLFGLVGLFGIPGLFPANPILLFIALFVWMGAEAEAQQVQADSMIGKATVSDFMAREFHTVPGSASLGQMAASMLPGFQTVFPVVDDGRLIGFIDVHGLARAISESGPDARVADFVERDVFTASPDEAVSDVILRWRASKSPAVAVMSDSRLVGLVTGSSLGEEMLLRSAQEHRALQGR